jgi:hypothetical protein
MESGNTYACKNNLHVFFNCLAIIANDMKAIADSGWNPTT